jgi:transcriptional regulator with PAS, ATPase and Fis domain
MCEVNWQSEIPIAITVCDNNGKILYMNDKSIKTFSAEGGLDLINKNLLDCHPGASKEKLGTLLRTHNPNVYSIEKDGKHKMIIQYPWFEHGEFAGLVEFSLETPAQIPHFIRR